MYPLRQRVGVYVPRLFPLNLLEAENITAELCDLVSLGNQITEHVC